MGALEGLQPAGVYRFFEEIAKIPHGSYHVDEIKLIRSKNKRRMGCILRLFFIQVADLAYHRRRRISSRFSVYIITKGAPPPKRRNFLLQQTIDFLFHLCYS